MKTISLSRPRHSGLLETRSPVAATSFETNTPRIVALILLAALVLFVLTGCRNAPRASTDINPAGVYTLVSVDGKTVPCNLTHEGVAMLVKSGSFTISADGTCRSLSTFCVPPHPDIHRKVKATYTQNGEDLTMRWERAGITKGRIDGDTFTMNNEGMIFRYRK